MTASAESTTVLVTGAMGQLGRRLVELLLRRGHRVVALDVPNEATRATAADWARRLAGRGGLTTAFVDLLDADGVNACLRETRPSVVIHLAAIVSPPCYLNPRLARRVNVEGTRNIVRACLDWARDALFVEASSSAVYGSRNPYRHPERITPRTPVNPVECYGEDKVAAEALVADSGLRHAILRLGGIISSDAVGKAGPEYFLLMRATPGDNRVHVIDVRDAAVAFANTVERADAIDGKVLLIGGDDSCVLLQRDLEDDVMQALGLGRLGASASLPGDPEDDRGWGLTDWFDTRESQALLDYQRHRWDETLAGLAESQGRRRWLLRLLGPAVRAVFRGFLGAQRRWERRGPYADPWGLVASKYGTEVLAPTRF
ncbi:NAD-dependent epimerase/dehydratase family protein [uncultured Abyssibacter sp.]|uniref:NAD-dependent epimerase/dehydratase family protein n=1 Tax=uncultured Abyssibacter sp. TaxID=2320202 RepID=UPI0032B19B58